MPTHKALFPDIQGLQIAEDGRLDVPTAGELAEAALSRRFQSTRTGRDDPTTATETPQTNTNHRRPTDSNPMSNQTHNDSTMSNAERLLQEALVIEKLAVPSYLATMTKGLSRVVSPGAWRTYLDRFLASFGRPLDPCEILLVEQLVMAHHAVGQLHVRAAAASSVDETVQYQMAISRLLGEIRRTVETLQRRTKQPQAMAGPIAGQAVGQNQEPRVNGCEPRPNGESKNPTAKEKPPRAELASKPLNGHTNGHTKQNGAKSPSHRRWEEKSLASRRADSRGPSEAQGGGDPEPTLASCKGSAYE